MYNNNKPIPNPLTTKEYTFFQTNKNNFFFDISKLKPQTKYLFVNKLLICMSLSHLINIITNKNNNKKYILIAVGLGYRYI